MAKKTKADIEKQIEDMNEEELAAFEASLDEAAIEEPTASEPVAEVPAPANTILLESGDRIVVKADQTRGFRVQDPSGNWYDHVKDAPDGEWVYRPVA